MKLKSLSPEYLTGIIEGKMADYNEHTTIPADLELSHVIEHTSYALGSTGKKLPSSPNSAKITFSWNNGKVEREEETDFAENKRDDDCFTILAGEPIVKLQMYVEELLDRLTA